jgi:hypothetical protein
MRLEDAYGFISKHLPYQDGGAFYGSAAGLSLGAGLLYSNVRQPAFNPGRNLYSTVKSHVYVVTHECDADQRNDRAFIDSVLVCPIIPYQSFIGDCATHPNLPGFLAEIATRRVYRLLYIPPIDPLEFGGVLYLNRITNVHVSAFSEAGTLCLGAVAGIGLREVDAALANLLLREKAQPLTGMRGQQ